jgi:GNAT superfamily N-acetyltransferase
VTETLTDIQAHLRASIATNAERVGPFLITFDPDTDNLYRNYAIPDDGAAPTPAQMEEMAARFTARDRTPRLELVSPAAAVEDALAAAGFTVDGRLPLMTLAPADLAPPPQPAGLSVFLATTDEQLWQAARVQNAAYGESEPGEPDLHRLRRTVDGGGAVALALLDGVPAGSGLYTRPVDGRTELAAVGVIEAYRRRGVATAVSYLLSRAALDARIGPYLQAEGPPEERMYARLGYRTVGALILASRPRVPA